jgi:hypothetical protein
LVILGGYLIRKFEFDPGSMAQRLVYISAHQKGAFHLTPASLPEDHPTRTLQLIKDFTTDTTDNQSWSVLTAVPEGMATWIGCPFLNS